MINQRQLAFQDTADRSCHDREVQTFARLACEFKETILNSCVAVFQAEVERGAAFGSRSSTFSPFAMLNAMSSANHDFSTFGTPARMNSPVDIIPSTQNSIGLERCGHELFAVYCFKFVHIFPPFIIFRENKSPPMNDGIPSILLPTQARDFMQVFTKFLF